MLQGVLTRTDILTYIKSKKLEFNPPLDKFQLQGHAVDLRLGFEFRIAKTSGLTKIGREAFAVDYADAEDRFELIKLKEGQFFDVLPKEAVVVTSLEQITLPSDLMAIMFPRSSVNRRGLSIDMSGIIDAGYSGRLLIPVKNNTSSQVIRIYPGERFCQIILLPLTGEITTEKSRWHKSKSVVGKKAEKHSVEEQLVLKGKLKDLKKKYKI